MTEQNPAQCVKVNDFFLFWVFGYEEDSDSLESSFGCNLTVLGLYRPDSKPPSYAGGYGSTKIYGKI